MRKALRQGALCHCLSWVIYKRKRRRPSPLNDNGPLHSSTFLAAESSRAITSCFSRACGSRPCRSLFSRRRTRAFLNPCQTPQPRSMSASNWRWRARARPPPCWRRSSPASFEMRKILSSSGLLPRGGSEERAGSSCAGEAHPSCLAGCGLAIATSANFLKLEPSHLID